MPLSAQTKDQITAILVSYTAAYNAHDPKTLVNLLADDCILYGCRRGEEVFGRDAVAGLMERNFARYKTGGIRFLEPVIKGEGVIAWLSVGCLLQSLLGDGSIHETPARFTAVFRGTGHAWEIVQIHISLAYPYHE